MKKLKYLLACCISIFLMNACGSGSSKTSASNAATRYEVDLAPAIGREFKILVVVNGALTSDKHVQSLKAALGKPFHLMNDSEPTFELEFIESTDLGEIDKKNRYIVLLANSSRNGAIVNLATKVFTPKSIDEIRTNPKEYMAVANDVWAENQVVMYLAANDKVELSANIDKDANKILDYFYNKELQRIKQNLYATGEQVSMNKTFLARHKINIRIPQAYNESVMEIGKDSIMKAAKIDGFEWLNLRARKSFNNLVISYVKYTDTSLLGLNAVIKHRNRVGRFIPCGAEGSYLGTEINEKMVAPKQRYIELNGNYAIETTGWWDCQNFTAGGPFINYAIVDEVNGRVVYVDAFVYAKGAEKKPYLARLQSIISTIDF
ncbi:MAG: DUF4837 family protein [Bacteroidetes bacterium]|nr:DUF4837 family protein [Bacteroidota bacterium]